MESVFLNIKHVVHGNPANQLELRTPDCFLVDAKITNVNTRRQLLLRKYLSMHYFLDVKFKYFNL